MVFVICLSCLVLSFEWYVWYLVVYVSDFTLNLLLIVGCLVWVGLVVC